MAPDRPPIHARPAAGRLIWAAVAVAMGAIILVSVAALFRQDQDPYSAARMSQTIELVCAETLHRWSLPRGRIEAELMGRSGLVQPDEGISSSHAQGRLTARPANDRVWREMVDRINNAKREALAGRRSPR